MNGISEIIRDVDSIEERIGYAFSDRSLLFLAFVHRSFVNENREVDCHNERLEFLGDSVLGLIIAEYLYVQLPNLPEGELSYLRSRLVEASSCMTYMQQLDLEKYLLLGRGERMSVGRGRETILSDLFEALIGAIYLDGGLNAAKEFFFSHFTAEVEKILKTPVRNWKALLQDYCQKLFQQTPTYVVQDESGPDHSKVFKVAVFLNDKLLGQGEGSSKKEAQQAAASNALNQINLVQ